MDAMQRDNSFEVDVDSKELLLEAYMEENKAYIRALNHGFPILEVEGSYSDNVMQKCIDNIEEQTLGKEILDLFADFTLIKNVTRIKCDIYDSRSANTERSVYLYKCPLNMYKWMQMNTSNRIYSNASY